MQADDARLLQADTQARATALDVSRSFIVQAPAGSGKTELLIQRYLGLLSIVEQPEEILAITFTRKAAFEMQRRIVTAMLEAKGATEVREGHQQVTREAAMRALARDRQQGWRLIESPQRLRIQTIDALNSTIARSLPVSSGLGATADVAADETARALYRSAAAATLDWLAGGGDDAAAVERLLRHLDNDSARYVEHIASMLETRDQWLSITGAGQQQPFDAPAVRKQLERNIARLIVDQLEKVARLLPEEVATRVLRLGRYAAANALQRAGPAHVLRALDERYAMPEAAESELQCWRAIAELLLTQSGEWRKTVNISSSFPPDDRGEKQEMIGVLEALANHADLADALHRVRSLPSPSYPDAQWQVLLALMRVLPLAVAELRRLLAEQRVTDYIEVAMAAHAALGSLEDPGDIALLLDYGVRHLLVDEMQDTSIVQYQLIEKLVVGWQPGDGRTMFCVGDPMQSIYRFRNAEVGEFLLAREKGVGNVQLHTLQLRRNFRSGEHLVHWFNRVFSGIFPGADDVASGAIAYADSVPAGRHGNPGAVRVYPVFGAATVTEADCGVQVIRDCLQARPDESVAVLVRSRTQLTSLLAKLRGAGIGYQAVDIDRLTDLPEIIELLALTRAICHQDDRIAWLGLLRAPWIGLSWQDLHALVLNDTRHTVWELMHDEMRLGALSPEAADRVALLREELGPWLAGHGTRSLQETVERLWYRLGGPQLLQDAGQVDNVYRFFDVLDQLEVSGTLPDVGQLESLLDQERVPSQAAADTRLQIMTMHKAKGLQFEHVVLYGLGRRTKPDHKSVLSWLSLPGGDGDQDILISPLGARADLEGDPLHNLIESRLREKDRLEQDRLLYVACTRARQSLHLIGHVPLTADGTGFRDPHAGSLLRRLWPAVEERYADAFTYDARRARDGRRSPRLRTPVLHRMQPPMPRPVLPDLPADRRAASGVELPDHTVDYTWVGAAARFAGTIVHRCLQQLADGRISPAAVRDAGFTSLAGRVARELGVPDAVVDEVALRARDALSRVLQDPAGQWTVFGPGAAELAVTGVRDGRVESVVIDRLRIDDDGVHWIVDYKTGTHEGGQLDRFLAQEVGRYRPQLLGYAALYRHLVDAPVRAALYFPLLQRFVEVPLDR